MSALRAALEQFDGTHTAALIAAKEVARDDLDGLTALCEEPDLAAAALAGKAASLRARARHLKAICATW